MNTEQLILFLQEVPLLCNLDEEEYYTLSRVCTEKSFDKGHIIFYEEDKGTNLYIIVSGQVKVSVLSNDGREHILGILKEKEFFGEISLLDGETRSTTVISLDKTEIITINRDDFMKILKNNPEITYKIILSLCNRIRWADKHVERLAFLGANGRVAKTILEMAEQQGKEENGKIIIEHKMTRQEFANLSGTSRETFTRIIMELQDEGILASGKNKIILLDKYALKGKIFK